MFTQGQDSPFRGRWQPRYDDSFQTCDDTLCQAERDSQSEPLNRRRRSCYPSSRRIPLMQGASTRFFGHCQRTMRGLFGIRPSA